MARTSRATPTTTGAIYQSLIARERQGDFLGGTVQVVPHVTNAIKERFFRIEEQTGADVVIELGGTIGDIEGGAVERGHPPVPQGEGHGRLLPHPREPGALHLRRPRGQTSHQHSVRELRSMGLQPDFIVCRSDHEVDADIRAKIASFCDVEPGCVFENSDCPSIYDVPAHLAEQGFDTGVHQERLGLDPRESDMSGWYKFTNAMHAANKKDDVTKTPLCRRQVHAAARRLPLHHRGPSPLRRLLRPPHGHRAHRRRGLTEDNIEEVLGGADGILVPGGFGLAPRGIEGKIAAAHRARTLKIPYLGVCLGLQVAVCEFARNVADMPGASSTEFVPDCAYPVIDLMPDQEDVTDKGGTMRLGAYPCKVKAGTLAEEAYGESLVYERHRHRFEVNNAFRDQLTRAGLVISGLSPDERLVEMVELPEDVHPWFVASQAHPEFKSRPTKPAPLFREFVRASIARHEGCDRHEVEPEA